MRYSVFVQRWCMEEHGEDRHSKEYLGFGRVTGDTDWWCRKATRRQHRKRWRWFHILLLLFIFSSSPCREWPSPGATTVTRVACTSVATTGDKGAGRWPVEAAMGEGEAPVHVLSVCGEMTGPPLSSCSHLEVKPWLRPSWTEVHLGTQDPPMLPPGELMKLTRAWAPLLEVEVGGRGSTTLVLRSL
jgi:hypothetical protein